MEIISEVSYNGIDGQHIDNKLEIDCLKKLPQVSSAMLQTDN